jgi:hypothetical protein
LTLPLERLGAELIERIAASCTHVREMAQRRDRQMSRMPQTSNLNNCNRAGSRLIETAVAQAV